MSDLTQQQAITLAQDIKKLLLNNGQWGKITEEFNSDGVKFYRIEGSIKVRK